VEAFAKSSYAYNVRHMYGLEGKRTNYSALSCVTMINAPPTRDRHDCHGCPFRQLDEAALKTVIETPTSAGGRPPTQADIEDILSDVRASQHQRACRRYFDLSHGSALGDGTLFRSPFAYYKASLDSAKAGIGPDAPGSSPTGRDTGFRRHADDASPAGDTSPMPGVRSAFVPRPSS
jgi:DNA primase large subunit